MNTLQKIGERIGPAIARDVLDNPELPREWTGLDPQDADQIPDGMDMAAVEEIAERVYLEAVSGASAQH